MKKSLFIALTSALLAIVFCFAACGNQTAGKTPEPEPKPDDPQPVAVKSLAITPTSLTASNLASAEYKTLSVTVEPADAEYEIEWSAAFENPESEWANGKFVYDYIGIEAIDQIGSSARVQATKAFGERIIITAALKADNSIKATCVCDYRKKIKTFDLVLGNGTVYNNFLIASNGLTAPGSISVGTALYSSFTNFVYTPGTIEPTNPTITKVELNVGGADFYNYINGICDGNPPYIITFASNSTKTLHFAPNIAMIYYYDLGSIYTLLKFVCGDIPESLVSGVATIAQAINEDLKTNVAADGSYAPKEIPGLTFKYTIESATSSGQAYYSAPVKYVYNPNFTVSG